MKKKLAILGIVLLLAGAAYAQIYVFEDEQSYRSGTESDFGVIPENGVTWDQANELYTPLGEGFLLLSALGGAYLIKKKKENNK